MPADFSSLFNPSSPYNNNNNDYNNGYGNREDNNAPSVFPVASGTSKPRFSPPVRVIGFDLAPPKRESGAIAIATGSRSPVSVPSSRSPRSPKSGLDCLLACLPLQQGKASSGGGGGESHQPMVGSPTLIPPLPPPVFLDAGETLECDEDAGAVEGTLPLPPPPLPFEEESIFDSRSVGASSSICSEAGMDFLSACHLCNCNLQPGQDVYIYRGDRAFCSMECRYQQMEIDEQYERWYNLVSKA